MRTAGEIGQVVLPLDLQGMASIPASVDAAPELPKPDVRTGQSSTDASDRAES